MLDKYNNFNYFEANNADIKDEMRLRGVRQWQIAEYLGINEFSLSRKMRHDLEPDFRNQVIEAIHALGSLREKKK